MSEVNICEKHAVNILKELWRQRESHESEKFCDVVLIAGPNETKIPAHSCVLSAASKYFQQMFMSSMRKSATKEVKIPIVDCAILQILVQYCYTGVVANCQDRIVELLETAEVLLLRNVVTICANSLAENLHPSNCLGFAHLAKQFRCVTLLQKAKDYSLEHFMKVRETVEFLNLSAEQLHELLASDDLNVSSEEDVFNSLKNWIDYNPAEPEKHKAQMLKLVRLPLLEKSFLIEQVKPMCVSPECLQIYIQAIEQRISPHYIKSNENNSVQPIKLNQFLMGIAFSYPKIAIHYHCPQRLKWLKLPKDLEYRWWPGLAVIEDNLFLVGGTEVDKTPLNTVLCLNLKTMILEEVSPMLEHRGWCGTAVLNGCLYAVGGKNKNDSVLSSVEKWHPSTNTWNKVASMAVSRSCFGLSVLNEKLYAVGGLSSGGKIDSAECYDPHLNVWMPIASMCIARYSFGLAVSNGLMYAVGGKSGIKNVERYNWKTNSWTHLCSISDTLASFECCTTFCDKVIVCHEDRIEEYNDETDEWKTDASLEVLRNIHRIFAYSGDLLTLHAVYTNCN